MKREKMMAVALVLLAAAALACAGGSGSDRGKGAGGGFGDSPPADSEEGGGLSGRTSGEGLTGDGLDLDLGDGSQRDGQFEVAINEESLETGLNAALQQSGYLGEGESAAVDIRRDETILTGFPYSIEETGTEVTAEVVYTVFIEGDGSVGVEVVSATFKTAQGLSIDLPAERMDALNAALEDAIETTSGTAAEMGVTWSDVVYSDTDMTLVGMASP